MATTPTTPLSHTSGLTPLHPLLLNPPLNITRVTDDVGLATLQDFFDRTLVAGGVLGWDIETTPLKDYFFRRIRTVQFGNQTEQYVIDLLAFCTGDNPADDLYAAQGDYGKHLTPSLKQVLDVLRPVVCSDKFLKVGVNLSFEYMSFYWLFGLRTQRFFDCALVEKCIWAGGHSLKDYHFFSMEAMMARYLQVQIEKKYQESFTLEAELSYEQYAYAALDTRFPLVLRQIQTLILEGQTSRSLQNGSESVKRIFSRIDPLITGDNLVEIAQIENDAIGAFQDMTIHGERLDRERWLKRVADEKSDMKSLLSDVLDPIFLPIVGSKLDNITDEVIAQATDKWKAYNIVSDDELALKVPMRIAKKQGNQELFDQLESQRLALETSRKATKEVHKATCSELSKRRTKIRNLAAKCEGTALINYGSDRQLIAVLKGLKGLKSISSLDDSVLEKYEHIPVMAGIRKYHSLAKAIGTYGDAWATEWKTKPCKEEGWLHPGDGRLHCIFNQYDAETGRSSSEKPNAQNLPQDTEIRQCFIADPPNETIRISDCCDADTFLHPTFDESEHHSVCKKCLKVCTTHAEEYVIITADMSGAELRIIAELADDPVWIGAFERKEDVHSVGTELLYQELWEKFQIPGCNYYRVHTPESLLLIPIGTLGDLQRKKCKCPAHVAKREDTKRVNFLLAYGGGPGALAAATKKSLEEAKELMALHEQKNPHIWAYLNKAGKDARILKRSFDMFGRRRLLPEPTWDRAKLRFREYNEEKLRLDDDLAESNMQSFLARYDRKPDPEEAWLLTHRLPSTSEISSALKGMHGSIDRQGKNHGIQGTNATIAKKVMGCGYSPDGTPYLWHTLPQHRSRLLKMVHDELVVHAPKHVSQAVSDLIGDAIKRAAAEKMTRVTMESEYHINTYWQK